MLSQKSWAAKIELQKLTMTYKVLDVTERRECGLLGVEKNTDKGLILAIPAVKHILCINSRTWQQVNKPQGEKTI